MTKYLDDSALEALLRADGHVPDEGFADRVIAKLPHRRRRLAQRDLVLGGATLLAGAIGAASLAGGDRAVLALAGASWVHAAALALGVGLALWGAVAAASSDA
jgi:hypothetical protein